MERIVEWNNRWQTVHYRINNGHINSLFPTAAKWETSAPIWAKGKWEQVRAELITWCEKAKIPLVIEDNAWVEFDES